jgi:oligopeptide transport system substrate-binding protein
MRKLALLLGLALCASVSAQQPRETTLPDWKKEFVPEDDSWKSVKQELIFNNGAEPETLDPAIMTGVTEHTLALALFEGLTSHDPETLEPRPGVATSWTLSDDQLTYTFKFRGDAKWTNGDPVTPEDFRWSWYRCLNGTVACDYAYLFDYIEGARTFLKASSETYVGTKKPLSYEEFCKRVGITIPDEGTLVVKLQAPCAFFLDLCSFETFMPVHRTTVERFEDNWTRPGNFVGNGPYTLADHQPRQHIVMTPNRHYWDAAFCKLTKITALPLENLNVIYDKFVKREVHWIKSVATAKLDEAKRMPEYYVMPYLGSYFYRFNVTREHLKDKRVRQALSLAVNRQVITRDVTRAGQIPAPWFCPPVAGYEPPKGWKYDPERARTLLKEAGYPNGEGFPKLTIFYNTSEDHKKVAERIAQMWRETLNINATLQNAEWKVYLNQVEQLDYDIARAGWIGDYGDPMTFMDMWLTGGGNNNTGWSNKRYDELIRACMKEADHGKRLAMFKEAEKLLIEDEFPILPVYIYVNQGMKVDALQGWYENVRDLHPFQYMYFEPAE